MCEVLHPVGGVVGHDHALHDRQAVVPLEHVLGAAEADALGAELPGAGGVLGRVGVGAHRHRAGAVGPLEDRRPGTGCSGRAAPAGRRRRRPSRRCRRSSSGRPRGRSRPPIAIEPSSRKRIAVTPQTAGLPMPTATIAAWLVLPPRAVRMPCASTIPWKSSGVVSSRTRMTSSPALPRRSASSAVKTTAPTAAPGDALTPLASGSGACLQVELGQQELAYLVGLDQGQQRLLLAQHALGDQVDRDPGHRLGAALAVARLQHVERAVLDGELHVLHVAVGRLELVHGADQLRVGLGDLVLQLHQRARRADARHHVLALGVDEEVAEGLGLLARHVAAGEGDAGPRVRRPCCRTPSAAR